jgi:hypothetical protein
VAVPVSLLAETGPSSAEALVGDVALSLTGAVVGPLPGPSSP